MKKQRESAFFLELPVQVALYIVNFGLHASERL